MEKGTTTSSSRRTTRSQVAPDWNLKDCLILVNEIAAVEADCSNALSSFQKWTMISENCNALDVHRTLNQCRRKWDSLLSCYNQIKQWELKQGGRKSGDRSYSSLSVEKRKKLNLPEDIGDELFEAINAVVMIQEDKAGTEPDSDPEAEDGSDVLDVTAELGTKRSRYQAAIVVKENPSYKTKTEEEPRRNQVLENRTEQREKVTRQSKPVEEKKKPEVEEISTDEEEEEAMITEEEAKAMEATLGEKADLIHEILGRNLAKDGEKGDDDVSIDEKMKFATQQGDELIVCWSEIVDILNRLRKFHREIK